jgi:hypothetical protein
VFDFQHRVLERRYANVALLARYVLISQCLLEIISIARAPQHWSIIRKLNIQQAAMSHLFYFLMEIA